MRAGDPPGGWEDFPFGKGITFHREGRREATTHGVTLTRRTGLGAAMAALAGAAPAHVAMGGHGWQSAYSPAQVPLEALLAAVRYAQWVYGVVVDAPAQADGVAPVVADAAVQDAY